MRGHYLREEATCSFQVVVVALHTHLVQLLRLVSGQSAQRTGNINVDLTLNGLDRHRDLIQQTLVWGFHRRDDTELSRARFLRLLGGFHQLRDIQANRAHRRLEQPRLRAKVAVFWAATGLDGDDSFDLHCRPTPLQTRLVRNIRQFFQLRVIAVENLDELFFV